VPASFRPMMRTISLASSSLQKTICTWPLARMSDSVDQQLRITSKLARSRLNVAPAACAAAAAARSTSGL
jgi:hypothetical protein